ncbi:hypothetical protein [Falsirhodobacter deserti]|uniref:hypothetical protein n=1 Tax=Falsirhodobacter deserti TaxID=1365611 RepID=UPI0013E3D55E|nr:hypothetical protein [Falsirhodobacter deserti]
MKQSHPGMIQEGFPEAERRKLLDPGIIVLPLLWLASEASDGVTGRDFDAFRWRNDLPGPQAAMVDAGRPEGRRDSRRRWIS